MCCLSGLQGNVVSHSSPHSSADLLHSGCRFLVSSLRLFVYPVCSSNLHSCVLQFNLEWFLASENLNKPFQPSSLVMTWKALDGLLSSISNLPFHHRFHQVVPALVPDHMMSFYAWNLPSIVFLPDSQLVIWSQAFFAVGHSTCNSLNMLLLLAVIQLIDQWLIVLTSVKAHWGAGVRWIHFYISSV